MIGDSELYRRTFLTLFPVMTTLTVAGCSGDSSDSSDGSESSDCTIEQSTEAVDAVPVSVKENLGDPIELELEWNARTQSTLHFPDADPPRTVEPEGDRTFLVFKFEFKNVSDRNIEINSNNFQIRATTPDTIREIGESLLLPMAGTGQIESAGIITRPSGTIDGQTYFSLPSNTTEATFTMIDFTYGNEAEIPHFTSTCNRSLSFFPVEEA